MNGSTSEVAALTAQIAAEYEAAQRGLSGLAAGTSRHDFIDTKMQRIDAIRQALAAQIGEDEAMATIIQVTVGKS